MDSVLFLLGAFVIAAAYMTGKLGPARSRFRPRPATSITLAGLRDAFLVVVLLICGFLILALR